MTNPHTDTVEAVARAIYEASPRNRPWILLNAMAKDRLRAEARAAIAAMPGNGEAMRETADEAGVEAVAAGIENRTASTHAAFMSYWRERIPEHIKETRRAEARRLLALYFEAIPPAAEPYAWLCTSPELDPVIVYGRENAETYAAHSERWTVEPLYRGPKFAPPLPPAQEG